MRLFLVTRCEKTVPVDARAAFSFTPIFVATLGTRCRHARPVLHDIVEDTGWTLEALRREGFPEDIVEAVASLTRQQDESYEAFIERAAQHPIARRVKLADLEDNMDTRRLKTLTKKDQSRLARYLKAWRRLKGF